MPRNFNGKSTGPRDLTHDELDSVIRAMEAADVRPDGHEEYLASLKAEKKRRADVRRSFNNRRMGIIEKEG